MHLYIVMEFLKNNVKLISVNHRLLLVKLLFKLLLVKLLLLNILHYHLKSDM